MTFIIVLIVLLSSRLESVNLFAEIGNVKQFPFLVDENILNVGLILEYGNKTLFNKFETMPNEMIAKLIVAYYGEKWDKLTSVDLDSLDLMSGNFKLIDEKGTHQEDRNKDDKTTQKVGAFNSEDFVNDNESVFNGVDALKGSNDKVTKISDNAIGNLWDNLQTVQKNSIINTVLYDVQEFLTISIYKD